MKIWIDADACPRVIKEIIFRASERLSLPVLLVANKSLSKHNSELIESIVVADGFDIADDYIAEKDLPKAVQVSSASPTGNASHHPSTACLRKCCVESDGCNLQRRSTASLLLPM